MSISRTDFLKYFAALSTLLLGVLGFVVTQYPTAVDKYTYVGAFAALMIIGSLSQIFSEKVAAGDRRKIREALGSFIEQAQKIQTQASTTVNPLPQSEFHELWRSLTGYLEKNLGHSYVVRLSDGMGMLPVSGPSGQHGDIWYALRVWIIRLQEFSQELPQ
jgi:hypothetical protein